MKSSGGCWRAWETPTLVSSLPLTWLFSQLWFLLFSWNVFLWIHIYHFYVKINLILLFFFSRCSCTRRIILHSLFFSCLWHSLSVSFVWRSLSWLSDLFVSFITLVSVWVSIYLYSRSRTKRHYLRCESGLSDSHLSKHSDLPFTIIVLRHWRKVI